MTLSGLQALFVLAVCCALFLRWGCIRDESSRTEGTARSQGERAGDVPVPGAYRPEGDR